MRELRLRAYQRCISLPVPPPEHWRSLGGSQPRLRDRDAIYGSRFTRRITGLGMREIRIAPRAPWQNPFAERLIGSIRRECLDHVIVLNECHSDACFALTSRTTTRRVRTRALATTAPMGAKPRQQRPDASWRSQKSVAFITDTAASPDRRFLPISGPARTI